MSEEQLQPNEQPAKRTRKKSADLTPEEREFFKKQGKKVKSLGSSTERLYAKLYRELWEKCKTSRLVSKLLDNCGVDLAFIPINIQVKAGAQRGLSVSTVLKEMQEAIDKNYPEDAPERKYPNVVIHHKYMEVGEKREFAQQRASTDSIVSMTHDTFFDLMARLHEKGKYLPQITIVDNEVKPVPEENSGEE